MSNRKFRFLPDIATADLAFEAFGRDYNELFENAGYALESAMVDLATVNSKEIRKVRLENENIENLLTSFLEELIFIKDAEELLINSIVCKIKSNGESERKTYKMECRLAGERIDRDRHKLGVDIKAVTKHLFRIEKLKNKTFCCRVVLDI